MVEEGDKATKMVQKNGQDTAPIHMVEEAS
jgi:hypothetical protein